MSRIPFFVVGIIALCSEGIAGQTLLGTIPAHARVCDSQDNSAVDARPTAQVDFIEQLKASSVHYTGPIFLMVGPDGKTEVCAIVIGEPSAVGSLRLMPIQARSGLFITCLIKEVNECTDEVRKLVTASWRGTSWSVPLFGRSGAKLLTAGMPELERLSVGAPRNIGNVSSKDDVAQIGVLIVLELNEGDVSAFRQRLEDDGRNIH